MVENKADLMSCLINYHEEIRPLSVEENWEERLSQYKKQSSAHYREIRRRIKSDPSYSFVWPERRTSLSLEEIIQVFKTAGSTEVALKHRDLLLDLSVGAQQSVSELLLEHPCDKVADFMSVWPVVWRKGIIDQEGFLNCDEDMLLLSMLHDPLFMYLTGSTIREVISSILDVRLAGRDIPFSLKNNPRSD